MKTREILHNIQQELKAPKSQFNKFGSYKYRNAEDILESVKPLLAKNNAVLILHDEIVNIGNRFYVKATASITDVEINDAIDVIAFAREEETKKGMDGSQITGASSSYARKYALNGLFLIDDTKDSDSTNVHDKETKETKEETRSFNDPLSKCKTVDDIAALYDSMTDEERSENKALLNITKRRVYKENFDTTLKNMKKNHWTEKKQFDLEDVIDNEKDAARKTEMISALELRLKVLGIGYKYEDLPFNKG